MDGVARMVASGAYGATGLAGPALGTLAAAISASTAVTAIADVTVAALASAGRGIAISFDTRIANGAVAGSPAISGTVIGALTADAGASLGARSALVEAVAWPVAASGARVAVAAGLALGALAWANAANATAAATIAAIAAIAALAAAVVAVFAAACAIDALDAFAAGDDIAATNAGTAITGDAAVRADVITVAPVAAGTPNHVKLRVGLLQ